MERDCAASPSIQAATNLLARSGQTVEFDNSIDPPLKAYRGRRQNVDGDAILDRGTCPEPLAQSRAAEDSWRSICVCPAIDHSEDRLSFGIEEEFNRFTVGAEMPLLCRCHIEEAGAEISGLQDETEDLGTDSKSLGKRRNFVGA